MNTLSRRKVKKLLREKSNESSLSLSLSHNRDKVNELSFDKMRLNLKRTNKVDDQSTRNLITLIKLFQMNGEKMLDFDGCFYHEINENPNLLNHLMLEF